LKALKETCTAFWVHFITFLGQKTNSPTENQYSNSTPEYATMDSLRFLICDLVLVTIHDHSRLSLVVASTLQLKEGRQTRANSLSLSISGLLTEYPVQKCTFCFL